MEVSISLGPLFPDSLSLPVAIFLLAASTITSMITASLGAGGGVLLLVLMATWMPPTAIIPVQGIGGPFRHCLRG